jgi:lambda family phage tail tape measure protein
MADATTDTGDAASLSGALDGLQSRTSNLTLGVNGFSRALNGAFAKAVTGGKQFDDVLKSLVLRLSDATLRSAFQPISSGISSGLNQLIGGLFAPSASAGAANISDELSKVQPFATGGVVSSPTYFPFAGGLGLTGEAGPEAILPLARGADGRLGVAAGGGGAPITVQISAPDVESFRRSEAYITGQIARAVARGQRSL